MASGAWEALRSLSTVAEIAAVLLSSPPAPPESVASLRAKEAVGTYARLGPALLMDGEEEFGTRSLRCELLGELMGPTEGEVIVHGVALFFRGEVVGVVRFAPVAMDDGNPELLTYIDMTVSRYEGGEQ